MQNVSNIVSNEIEKLLYKGKHIKNKKVHAEVSGKIAIWIANILEETAYRILEDQLRGSIFATIGVCNIFLKLQTINII